ncbi:MAG: VWA domain-containing protein [Clostridiales bacterium]|nr:VWA domain-containing protein [Clostridiales bacterium]
MATNITELVFILDRSGSMAGLEDDTIGGYNTMLQKQRELPGEVRVTTVLFDNYVEVLHDRIDLRAVSPITEKEYYVRGSTALLDAIGSTVSKIGNVQKHTAPEYRADKVLFVIITDGMENASREYDYDTVKHMVERQKKRYGWEFLFLGANMDAAKTASRFGIGRDRAQCYHADREGTRLNYAVTAKTVLSFRETGAVPEDWNGEIGRDYAARRRENR